MRQKFVRFVAALAACLVAGQAIASKSPTEINAEIDANLPDNKQGAITESVMRATLKDIAAAQVSLYYLVSSCAANQWVSGFAATGAPSCSRPAFSNLSGSIQPGQMIAAGSGSLGGVYSSAAGSNQFATGIDTAGAVTYAQPSFSNLSGQIAASQLIAPTLTTLGGVKAIADVPSQWLKSLGTDGVFATQQLEGPDILHGAVTVNTTAELAALSYSYASVVIRLGVSAAGDAPAVLYRRSNSACSLNAGAGDGGSQVPTSDGKCWVAIFPAHGADIRAWGCFADGSTDVASCVTNAAANYSGRIVIPATTSGFYVGSSSTITLTKNVSGEAFTAINNLAGGNIYPGASWIKCAVPRSATCVVFGAPGTSPNGENLVIAGAGTASATDIGLQVIDGQSVTLRNIFSINFGSCLKLGPESATGGLGAKFYNVNLGGCKKFFIENDGWPEAYFHGGRVGVNGPGEPTDSEAYVYQTRTGTLGAGGGPNTMTFDSVQFNTGTGGVGCAFKWGGYTGSGGTSSNVLKVANSHVEWHTYSGASLSGIFCSDATLPLLNTVQVSSTDFSVNGAAPVFNLNALTAVQKFYLSNSNVDCAATTLAPTPASGFAMQDVHFANSTLFCNMTITASGAGSTFQSVGTKYGALTITGPWAQFASAGDYFSSISTGTATGQVSIDNFRTESWTPTLNFGGATTGITQSVQAGLWQRTAGGGTRAYFIITLSSKGTATGAATITGFPVTCGSSFAAAPLTTAGNLSGLTSTAFAKTNGVSSSLSLQQMGAAGIANLTDTNFTNTSSIAGTVTCGTAQ